MLNYTEVYKTMGCPINSQEKKKLDKNSTCLKESVVSKQDGLNHQLKIAANEQSKHYV